MEQFLFSHTPLALMTLPLSGFEASNVYIASKGVGYVFELFTLGAISPLYYILLNLWSMIVGGGGEVYLRSLSLLFYSGNVYVLYLILRRVLSINKKFAHFALLALAVNPLLIVSGFEVGPLSLIIYLTSISFYAFFLKRKKIYAISIFLLACTHVVGFVVVVLHIAYATFYQEHYYKKVAFLTLAFLIPFLFGIGIHLEVPLSGESLIMFLSQSFTGLEYSGILKLPLSLLLLILSAVFSIEWKKNTSEILLLIALWCAVSFGGLISTPLYNPVFMGSIGFGLLVIVLSKNIHTYLRVITVGLISFVYLIVVTSAIYERVWDERFESYRFIDTIIGDADLVYVNSLEAYLIATYYFKSRQIFLYGAIPTRYDIAIYGDIYKNVATNLPVFPQKAFLLKSSGDYEIASIF